MTSGWVVETLDELVDAELEALPVAGLARLRRIVERIQALGLENVGEPHVKYLEGKIWEMRAKAADGTVRAAYVTVVGRRVVIVHAFIKKSQKTPKRNLEIARARAARLG